ncbi:ATP-dependent DNA helicase DinG [Paludibacterium purpuratum]|uniref:ATP-dependent DNA helicase DinG n=1 Tax=Paludibacterium purpuratum TaxID=1144873 RepID=A0A4R7B5A2_9NEIS|nr:ATP-dependent DNA helicase DinG [Paludibacterium purpuratum]TDR79788.1 ATP-dependent DNA helicase DinG [Paludibacterium purpuratum]
MLTDVEKEAIRHHYRTMTQNLPGFRPRPAQRQMLAEIANAFSRALEVEGENNPQREGESIAVIEGPTGVGKSLAYLLAGGVMARSRNKKLVISSATVALQEQLINRDLPFVVANSDLPLTYAIAKGRSRYLCPYRLYQLTNDFSQQELLAPDPSFLWDRKPEKAELDQLRQLADDFEARRWNGDRDQWPEVIEDAMWARVTTDRHGCLKAACPNRPECPFFLARETLENVDVVVTNHDLMLADIGMGGGVILPAPEQSFYCIDEAHHLAKKAINQFAAEHSLGVALAWLDKVDATAARVAALTNKGELAAQAGEAAAACTETLSEWLWLLEGEKALALDSDNLEPVWLIEDGALPEHLQGPAANMAMSGRMVFKHLSQLSDALADIRKDKGSDAASIDKLSSDLGFLLARSEQLMALWDLFEKQPAENEPPIAKWVARRSEGKGDYLFCASPVSAAASLAGTLWRRAAGALLTSATLRSLGAFDLLLAQTGLKWLPQVSCIALDSPFNFSEQGELYLPPMIASPKDANAHTREIAEWLPKLIDTTEPVGSLVLFSSRKQMQEVAALVPTALRDRLLVQGEWPKSVLLAEHLQRLDGGQASVIFGLDSFSEGLDLPGERCVHVIIAKLPFAMPDDPVGRTLSRWIEKRGGNPFTELTVPEASIKLVQAVGRLIRSERDYGRVTILDNRLVRQSYGKKMLASLPPFRRI